ncbi:hypothetical protein Hanom_Chr11g00975001 [Helianthus anomalus]
MGYVWIYKKNYMNTSRLGYEKPPLLRFALRASILDVVAFVRLSLFKTKSNIHEDTVKRLEPSMHVCYHYFVHSGKKTIIQIRQLH